MKVKIVNPKQFKTRASREAEADASPLNMIREAMFAASDQPADSAASIRLKALKNVYLDMNVKGPEGKVKLTSLIRQYACYAQVEQYLDDQNEDINSIKSQEKAFELASEHFSEKGKKVSTETVRKNYQKIKKWLLKNPEERNFCLGLENEMINFLNESDLNHYYVNPDYNRKISTATDLKKDKN